MAMVPIVLVVLFTVLWAIPATRDIATGRYEGNPVEVLTFLFMGLAGVLAFRLAARMWRLGHTWWVVTFFVLFGIGSILVAMDEIAWGRVLADLIRNTPPEEAIEPAVVNLTGLRDRTELFRLAFAIAGVIGVFLGRVERFRIIAAPKELLPWLVVIGVVSGIDVYGDIVRFSGDLQDFFVRSSELIEMMIAMVAVLYAYFKIRDLWFRIP